MAIFFAWLCLLLPLDLFGFFCYRDQCEFFSEFIYYSYSTDHFWNKSGHKKPAHNDLRKHGYKLLTEFGLTDRDTLFLLAGYSRIDESLNGRTLGFDDLQLGWRQLLWCDQSQFIGWQAIAIIPSGKPKACLRYGRPGFEANVIYSRYSEWRNRSLCFESSIGYRIYKKYPSDQIRGSLSLAYDISPRWQLAAAGELEYGVFNGKHHFDYNIILFNPNYRLLRFFVQAAFCITSFAYVTTGYYWHAWGQNVGTGGGWFAGAAVDF